MFSLLTSYFTQTKFVHSYIFSDHNNNYSQENNNSHLDKANLRNNNHMILGITNNNKVGIAFQEEQNNEFEKSNSVISKIYVLNYVIRDKCNNNEIIYYFGENNNQIRLKFYVKNNVKDSMKDFYYHLFSVEENIDIHIKLKEEYVDFFINPKFNEMSQHFKNSDLIYFIHLISQDRKIICNKIPFIKEKEYNNSKEEVNLLSF